MKHDFDPYRELHDRRQLAVCYLPECELMAILRWRQMPFDTCIAIDSDHAPPDARVEGVFVDHTRRAIGIVLEHRSFPPHEPGSELPIVSGRHRLTIRKLNIGEMSRAQIDLPGLPFVRLNHPMPITRDDVFDTPLAIDVESKGGDVAETPGEFFRRVMGTD